MLSSEEIDMVESFPGGIPLSDERIFLFARDVGTRAPVAQWVVHLTRTRLIPGLKHDWCKNPLVFAMIAG